MLFFNKKAKSVFLAILFLGAGNLAFQSPVTAQNKVHPVITGNSIPTDYLEINEILKKTFDPQYHLFAKTKKSRDELIFLLDTVYDYAVSSYPVRYTYGYSQQGYRTNTLMENFENNAWNFNKLNENTYDANGNLLLSVWKYWDNNLWINATRTLNQFDASNNLTQRTDEVWDTASNTWVKQEQNQYVYNTAGKVVSHLKTYWNDTAWVNFSKEIYAYNALDQLTYVLGELWNDTVWRNDQKYTYTYDNNGNLITSLYKYWDEGQWKNNSKDSSVYNSANNKTYYLLQTWDDSLWFNSLQYNYTYNDLDYLETCKSMIWQDTVWENLTLTTYSYGVFGSIENLLNQTWSEGAWQNESMNSYAYDENGNALTGNYYTWDDIWTQNEDGILRLTYDENTKTESYYGYRFNASYSSMSVGINQIKEELTDAKVFPNPLTENSKISFTLLVSSSVSIHVLNMAGQEVSNIYSGKLAKGKHVIPLNTVNLPQGLYFLEIKTKKFRKILKICETY